MRKIIQFDLLLFPSRSASFSETNKDFVSRNFAFFDCSVHDSCFKCLKSQWSCNWCIYDNKCVVQNTTCRNTGSIINAENVCFNYFQSNLMKRSLRCAKYAGILNRSLISLPIQQCPRIKPAKSEILLPNKVPKEIKLEIINLPRPQSAHSGFLCIVNIEGAHMILPARIEQNKFIVCDKTPVSFSF